jgi:phage-related protein
MKKVYWMGSSQKEIRSFPREVRQEIGFSIEIAQNGRKALNAVPLVGFNGAGVLEVISNGEGGTYRTVYTVKFDNVLYVLHAFQKKSKTGIATSKKDLDLIKDRLATAEQHYREMQKVRIAEKKNVGTDG